MLKRKKKQYVFKVLILSSWSGEDQRKEEEGYSVAVCVML